MVQDESYTYNGRPVINQMVPFSMTLNCSMLNMSE